MPCAGSSSRVAPSVFCSYKKCLVNIFHICIFLYTNKLFVRRSLEMEFLGQRIYAEKILLAVCLIVL